MDECVSDDAAQQAFGGKHAFPADRPGSSPTKAERKATSATAPMVLAYGELIGRERNQCREYMASNAGSRNAARPNAWSARSATIAPTTPIQLCAGFPARGVAAVLSEGSSGEYDSSGKEKEDREDKSRKPMSSLSRRLRVGVNGRARFILACSRFEGARLRGPMLIQYIASRQETMNTHACEYARLPERLKRASTADTPEREQLSQESGAARGEMGELGVAK